MFERILLATDGSKDAQRAQEYARDLALRDGAQVIVVHAFEAVPRYLGEPMWSEIVGIHVSKGREVADRVKEQLEDAGVDVEIETLQGPPAEAILRVAETRNVGLIVMGTRGYGELTSLLLGSVSHRVLAHTRVPVMVVRAEEEESVNRSS